MCATGMEPRAFSFWRSECFESAPVVLAQGPQEGNEGPDFRRQPGFRLRRMRRSAQDGKFRRQELNPVQCLWHRREVASLTAGGRLWLQVRISPHGTWNEDMASSCLDQVCQSRPHERPLLTELGRPCHSCANSGLLDPRPAHHERSVEHPWRWNRPKGAPCELKWRIVRRVFLE